MIRSCETCRFMHREDMSAGNGQSVPMLVCRRYPPIPVAMPAMVQVQPSVRNPNGGVQMQCTISPMAPVVTPSHWCYEYAPVVTGV